MRIALAQINPTLGAFQENAAKIIEYTKRAFDKHASLVVFPELCLFGYPPYDLLERLEIVKRQEKEIARITKSIPAGITVVFGAVLENKAARKSGGKPYWNTAVVARKDKTTAFFPKQLLPSYDVFDEARFFEPGTRTGVCKVPGVGSVVISVCEDMWAEMLQDRHKIYRNNPLKKTGKADLIINISASPFSARHFKARKLLAQRHSKSKRTPFVYVNQVGGQDELIFDGQSFVLDEKGRLLVQAAPFEEDLVIVDVAKKQAEYRPSILDGAEQIRAALILGVRDFVRKSGLKSVHLGLSGGIDSAVAAALAVDALGPGHVTGFLLPGPYSSEGSVNDSVALAKNLGIKTYQVSIRDLYEMTKKSISVFTQEFDLKCLDIMDQNIQARLRSLVMMSYGNAANSMLLMTTNKSEMATGYGTMYGDLSGGLAPLGDLLKRDVYRLAKLYNKERDVIPEAIINKPPSAELAPHQSDQDTLPPYEILDKAVENLVVDHKAPSSDVELWLLSALLKTEWKRWQAPPVLRVTDRAFGKGRRFPLANSLLKSFN